NEFTDFVSCIYFVYRKIEMKMKKNRYKNTLKELESEENSYADINETLTEAEKVFNSTDKADFLKIYSVFKKLFFSYINYMKDSTNVKNGIHEQDFLPGKIDPMKLWLQKLDKWFPININGEWKNSAGQ